MSFVRNVRLAFLLLFLCAVSGLAQQADAWTAKIQRIEQMVQEEMQKNSVPGIAIAIAKDGKVVYAKGFGYADVENKVPFTPQTVSRIGGIL